jgi:23S rRNA pseudouridine1911/1915/1917 synthase
MKPPGILFLDNHIFVVRKPAGTLIQGDRTGDTSLLAEARGYLKRQFNLSGEVYLGLVHRLDRPTSGVVAFARTSEAAAHLSKQFRKGQIRKIYWALVEGKTPVEGTWVDRIARMGPTSRVVRGNDGQHAALAFRRLGYRRDVSWVEVELQTGRHHQIRVQFAYRGYPVLGDFRYGSDIKFGRKALGLHARSLTLTHPATGQRMAFTAEPDEFWRDFGITLAGRFDT